MKLGADRWGLEARVNETPRTGQNLSSQELHMLSPSRVDSLAECRPALLLPCDPMPKLVVAASARINCSCTPSVPF